MNAKRIVAALVFADFAALNVWAAYSVGMSGLIEFFETMGPWGYVVAADVLIALSMVVAWMWTDAKRSGRSPYGFLALTAFTGSLGPLLYVATSAPSEERLPGNALSAG